MIDVYKKPKQVQEQKTTPIRTREDVLKEIHELEVKADHYSRTDWDAYNRVRDQLKNLDMILLDIYSKENETFLMTHPKPA